MSNLMRLLVLYVCLCATTMLPAHAFNEPVDTVGFLTARIEGPPEITQADVAAPLRVVLSNAGGEAVSGTVALGLIDGWQAVPAGSVPFTVEANGTVALEFTVTPGKDTYTAHYPIHAWVDFTQGGQAMRAHPVQIVEPHLAPPALPRRDVEWRPYEARVGTEVPLWRVPVFRAMLAPAGPEPGRVTLPGWQGSDEETRGCVFVGREVDRGGIRACIVMHPPWQGERYRSVVTEFPVKLPDAKPITLRFANAMRTTFPERGEPPTDGVTFRVRVLPFDAPDGVLGDVLFEQNTAATTWRNGEADLSTYAGQTVRIQIESHPGPQNNVTCDESYWAEPTLVAGSPPAPDAGSAAPPRTLGVIERDGARYAVEVTPGARGLLDATVSLGDANGSRKVSFHGFTLRVLGDDLSDAHSIATLVSASEEGDRSPGHLHMRHRFATWAGSFDVLVEMWVGHEALQARFRIENVPPPKPWQVVYIEDVAAGPWDATARRIYAGDGNVIEAPEAFRLECDGHRLSTSFAGFEFEENEAVVQAVDVPPSHLDVDPSARRYSLHAAHDATLTFIPARTVWEGARVWHDINGLSAAGGVDALAGRFVFDLWGGSYARNADALKRAFRYGLVDSAVILHAWQRWGYDYRLPDIYPPHPDLGTVEDFRGLADACRQNGALFAPHDNYIDYYPDAEGFSYDKIAFGADGQPMRGWLNESRKAQAYRWRMDAVRPILERNLRLIKDNIAPSAYFIDVWSSIQPYDYWTRDGRFFDRVYTRNEIGQRFAWIRDFLGNHAPQISESGHDQLIGFLDGATTNHLRVWRPGEPDGGWMVWKIGCADAERVPWFDAAHHDRFVLHGAGYAARYTGGLDTQSHGIYSDDYICTEVLTGHPAMVSEPFGRDVVRKYWLLHDVMRALALQRIESVEFADNIHRQHVAWEGGDAWVNRGADDWTAQGHVLPPYGFYVRGPRENTQYEAAIERRDDAIVEWSSSPAGVYAGARPPHTKGTSVTAPDPAVRYLGDGRIELTLNWNPAGPTAGPLRVFVHFKKDGAIGFQGDFDPAQATSEWQGLRTDTTQVALPAEARPGQSYEVCVGLYDPVALRCEPLDGPDNGAGGIRLGTMRLEGEGDAVSGLSWTATTADPRLARMNPSGKAIDMGAITTDGACRVSKEGDALRVTPLPDSRPFTVRIRWSALPWALPQPTRVERLDENGVVRGEQSATFADGVAELKCAPENFAYRLTP